MTPISAFTGLRGLAALGVVAYHFRDGLDGHVPLFAMSALDQGFLAVDLFFILSGFVIYLNYRWMFENFTLLSAKIFIVARLARIYPVHLFMSLLFLINPVSILLLSHAKDLGSRYDVGYYVMSLFLIHNWGLTSHVEWNIPSWSISTEWFAYLMFPILLLGIGRSKEAPHLIVVKVIGLLAALAAFFLLVGADSIGDDIPRFGLARCLLEFMVGIEICRFYLLMKAPPPRIAFGLFVLAAGLVAVTALCALSDFMLVPAAFALLILSLTSGRSVVSRLLSLRPLLWLGEISYSLYMAHYFIKDWVKFANADGAIPPVTLFFLFMTTALFAGWAVYICIEKPGRRVFRAHALRKA